MRIRDVLSYEALSHEELSHFLLSYSTAHADCRKPQKMNVYRTKNECLSH